MVGLCLSTSLLYPCNIVPIFFRDEGLFLVLTCTYTQPPKMQINFCETHTDGTLLVKGCMINKEGAEGVTKAIMWFLKQSPVHAVHHMRVLPRDSYVGVPLSSIPAADLVEWNYRLPIHCLVVTLRDRAAALSAHIKEPASMSTVA